MSTVTLRNGPWVKTVQFLQDCPRVYVGEESECRCFIEGVLWVPRSGTPWRLLPERYGHWNSVYKHFARWCDHEVWGRMQAHSGII